MVTGWLLLFSPLLACVAIGLITRRRKGWSAGLGIGSMIFSFACAVKLLFAFLRYPNGEIQSTIPWVDLPGLTLEFGIWINPLSILMALVVTGVGALIFLYSVGYMRDEPGFTRYFAFLSLFAFSMLGIVLANNFITLFIFWELVGASSYLLIGYWYDRPKAAEAGKKAFLVNRIADFGFLIGILMLWSISGSLGEQRTLNFPELIERIGQGLGSGTLSPSVLWWVGALIFCGVVGKSAQFPLHVWLPDAMEGPTPVSALIHAATMVAAGVYLLARTFFLFAGSPALLEAIAWIGGFTALFAATLALVENDIKRVLAYSTLSQLGYMVMAVGLGGLVAGMFHLTTHAFFKALLFLGAGCVIHALHTNNIWEMGGLLKFMPITGWTFLVGALALSGIWPLSGFFSKDEILTLAFTQDRLLWIVATITAGMTAFYMGRVFCVAFLGNTRTEQHHVHEAPRVMTGPLLVLAALSVIGGFLGIPAWLHHEGGVHVEFNPIVAVISSAVALAGLGLAFLVYQRQFQPWRQTVEPVASFLESKVKFFVDDLYGWINRNVQQRAAIGMNLFERRVIIGLWVNGTARMTGFAGGVLRLAQTGKVQSYALALLAGLALILWWSL